MQQFNSDNFSAYMVAHDTISLSYRGEIIKEICDMRFLEFETLEQILFIKCEETAVSLPWIQTMIINFWNVSSEKYQLFEFSDGLRTLFQISLIKNLQEVQFKFFEEEKLNSLIKFKWIKSKHTNYFYIEVFKDDSHSINLHWKEKIKDDDNSELLFKQIITRNINCIFSSLNDNNDLKNEIDLVDNILEMRYDSIFIYYPSKFKLKISTTIYEQQQQQQIIELFIHEEWFNQQNHIIQFERLQTCFQKYSDHFNDKFSLDYALIFNEKQINDPFLMNEISGLLLKILLIVNDNVNVITLSLMPLEIHFEFDNEKQYLNLDINLQHEDPEDIYQEGLIILLQALTNCKLFKSLNINIQQDEYSQNKKFQLFPFTMVMYEFFTQLENFGTIIYNSSQLIPKQNQIFSKGNVNFLISDKKSMIHINDSQYLDIQKQIGAFLQYLQQFYSNCQSIIISCNLNELGNSSDYYFKELLIEIMNFQYIIEFGILSTTEKYNNKIDNLLLIPLIRYLNQKKKIITQMIIMDNVFKERFKRSIIDQIAEFVNSQE